MSRLPVKTKSVPKPGTNAIVPSDRMALHNHLFSKALKMPLSENLPTQRNKRVASPDFHSNRVNNNAKLRRSKSTADLNTIGFGSTKRSAATSIQTIPEKIQKSSAVASIGHRSRPMLSKPAATIVRPPSSKPTITVAGKKPIGAPSSGAGAIKPVKIPPYDFKARFHALNEKHTALKDKCSSLEGQLGELKDLPEKYTETVRIVAENAATIANLTRDCERATKAKAECEADQRNLLQSLKQANADLTSAKDELETLRLSFSKTTKECEYLEAKNKIFSSENETLKTELKQIRDILYNSNVERKELHNQMMDLRGNIRVFCRVRPPLPSEEDRLLCNISHIDESSLEVSSIDEMPSGARVKATKHEFNFDHIFHQYSEQDDVFQSVSPLIQSALDGYNVCIFAYGQTGSGKTYTMDGTSTDIGIIPRTVDLLFDCVQRYKLQGWEYSIKVTFLEIYNEILYDLLSNEAKDLEIRMVSAKTPTEIFVSNITEETVESASRLRQLMAIAKSNRATASTVGNERSSRSHAVTRLQMHGYHNKKNEICVGTINLVDLAGSECPKNSVRMDETKKINRSLSELTNVIMALVQKNEHVPYRNSKLTHLLMPCLGGNSKTLMIVNVSPFQECFNETTKSLRFASTVKSCKMNKSKKNRFLAIE